MQHKYREIELQVRSNGKLALSREHDEIVVR